MPSGTAARVHGALVAMQVPAVMAAFACGAAPPERDGGRVDSPAEAEMTFAAPVGAMTAAAPGGAVVRIELRPDPPAAGTVHVHVELDPPPADPDAVSVDVVAPAMPVHGVVRHAAAPAGEPGRFTAEIAIPMEGSWEFYVNLDVGTDAAAFTIPVGPGPGGDAAEAHRHDAGGGHRDGAAGRAP